MTQTCWIGRPQSDLEAYLLKAILWYTLTQLCWRTQMKSNSKTLRYFIFYRLFYGDHLLSFWEFFVFAYPFIPVLMMHVNNFSCEKTWKNDILSLKFSRKKILASANFLYRSFSAKFADVHGFAWIGCTVRFDTSSDFAGSIGRWEVSEDQFYFTSKYRFLALCENG